MDYLEVWRITDKKFKNSAFSGEGARLWGGRFNSPGKKAVYTSGSLSLALLETLVQSNDRSNLEEKVLIRATITEEIIYMPPKSELPDKWAWTPVSKASQRYGDDWITKNKHAVLKVPSVVVPIEFNYVINPNHPHFNRITITNPELISIDPRLWET
jgi:RES domain-containing protein